MASVEDICNLALSWLGASMITSLADNSTEAKLCKVNYPLIRDAVLEAADWSFAIKRATMDPLSTGPVFGRYRRFPIPPDSLRVLSVSESENDSRRIDWRVEENHVLAGGEIIYLRYIFRAKDPKVYSPLFVQALSARIAADLAIPIADSRTLRNENWDLYMAKLREATANDGIQGKHDFIRSDTLIRARRGSFRGGY